MVERKRTTKSKPTPQWTEYLGVLDHYKKALCTKKSLQVDAHRPAGYSMCNGLFPDATNTTHSNNYFDSASDDPDPTYMATAATIAAAAPDKVTELVASHSKEELTCLWNVINSYKHWSKEKTRQSSRWTVGYYTLYEETLLKATANTSTEPPHSTPSEKARFWEQMMEKAKAEYEALKSATHHNTKWSPGVVLTKDNVLVMHP